VTCPDCATRIAPDDPALVALGGAHGRNGRWDDARRGAGCAGCGGTGYRGRTGSYELYVPDEHDRRHIAARGSMEGIRRCGASFCVMSMHDSGAALARAGVTTPEEVRRVLSLDDDSSLRGSRGHASLPHPGGER